MKSSLVSVGVPALIALLALTVGLDRPGLLDPNEGLYAAIALEMLEGGDWVTPRFNGVVYFEKPPLLHWLVASSYALLGVSEAAARLPVALAGVAAVVFTALTGRLLFGARAGLLAGTALATSLGLFIFARNLKTDPVFMACLTATLWAVVRALRAPERRGRWLICYALAGLGVLTKGLIGVVLPALVLLGLAAATRHWRLLRDCRPVLGAAVALAIAAPWHVAVARANPEFAWFFFVNEHLLRFLNRRHLVDTAPQPVWLFLLMALVWALPWSLFLPLARRVLPRPGPDLQASLPWIVPCWAAAVLGFFALAPGRLEYYSLPALPAVALLAGRVWDVALEAPAAVRGLGWGPGLLGALGLALLGLAAVVARPGSRVFADLLQALDAYARDVDQGILAPPGSYTTPAAAELLPAILVASGVLVAGGGLAVMTLRRGRPAVAFACVAAAMLAVFPMVRLGFVLLEPHRSARPLAEHIQRLREPGDAVVVDGPYENFASLAVYAPGGALVLDGLFGDLAFGARRAEARARFLDAAAFARLWEGERRVFLLTGSPDRVRAALRRAGAAVAARAGARWLVVNRR